MTTTVKWIFWPIYTHTRVFFFFFYISSGRHFPRLALLIDLDNDRQSHCQGRPTGATSGSTSFPSPNRRVPMPFLLSRSTRRRAVAAGRPRPAGTMRACARRPFPDDGHPSSHPAPNPLNPSPTAHPPPRRNQFAAPRKYPRAFFSVYPFCPCLYD